MEKPTIRPRSKPSQPFGALYDLRVDAGMVIQNDQNKHILDMLDRLIVLARNLKASSSTPKEKASQTQRLSSFQRAKDSISSYSNKIISGNQAQHDIPGVGKGIATRIDEFIRTGTLKELVEGEDPETRAVLELCTVTGIGEVKAASLVRDHGIMSVADLRHAYKTGKIKVTTNQLTNHIVVGLKYYDDLTLRMPWAEADQIAGIIKGTVNALDPLLIVTVCGSYRRQRETCGDIDVLVSNPRGVTDDSTLGSIVAALETDGLLVGHLTHDGKTKYMGVCQLPGRPGRRIDIRYIDHNSLGAATLYFTGSGKFNKIMRYRANDRGYTLNEYGLFTYVNRVKGSQIPAPREEDIFSILGFVYLPPVDREF